MQIRPARSSDVPAIERVVHAAYRGTGGWTTEVDLVDGARIDAEGIRRLLADPDVVLLVATEGAAAANAESEPRLVGCAYTRHEGARAEFGLFAVDPSAQAGGIGSALLEAQAEQVCSAGAEELVIYVLQDRPELTAWYERRGFRSTGVVADFPEDPALLRRPGLGMAEMIRTLSAPLANADKL